ncbi:MAG: sigma-54 dependent transcriptional regulator [Polyangiaceae bacterium]
MTSAGAKDRERVLVVDDDAAMRELLEQILGSAGFEPVLCASAAAALEMARERDVDAVVTDLRMPVAGLGVSDGNALCRELAQRHPGLPVIVLTAFGGYDEAVEAMRAGAYDFLSKPVEVDTLVFAIRRALERRALKREVQRLARSLETARGLTELFGESAAMARARALLERITDSDASVLITGESGTGKEVAARELHRRGPRAAGPFIALNCAAMPEALLEAELFGHEEGAFTDARARRAGLLVEANGGTLFLDEIGDMPLTLQAKLLRALQERSVRPVGGRREVTFDARIVSATNRDLMTMIEEGRFREDLYFRLNVIQVELPPLREREGDVLLLAQRFLQAQAQRAGKQMVGIEARAAKLLSAYRWPGNVRELQNCIERAVALARYDHVTVDDLPDRIVQHRPAAEAVLGGDGPATFVPLEELERLYILRVLDAVGGSRSRAAQILGLDRTTLWRRLERYGAVKKT